MSEKTLLWNLYPSEVQVLLNMAQVLVDAKAALRDALDSDLVALRRVYNRDINAIIDRVGQAESDLKEAVRVYQKAGGNAMTKETGR